MMDKKDSKKKGKPLKNKQISETSEKENMKGQTGTLTKANVDNSLITINLKQARKNCERLFQIGNSNTLEYNNRKRSLSLLTADDFVTDVTNEKYWQNLAECDRAALNSALSENRDLHNRITELEHENVRLKVLLDEAKSLVEVLTELLEEDGEDSLDEKSDGSIWDDL